MRANPGVDVWLPGAGPRLVLPGRRILPAGPRAGLVVNLPEHRLYYYPKPRKGEQPVVITYPVSIGKMDWRTPLGETRDRKSTRLNSSHLVISYAVFCLKKKKKTTNHYCNQHN